MIICNNKRGLISLGIKAVEVSEEYVFDSTSEQVVICLCVCVFRRQQRFLG